VKYCFGATKFLLSPLTGGSRYIMYRTSKTSLVFTNRFSEANYRIIFAEKVMPEKQRRVFWTQGRASKLHFLAGPPKV